MSSFQQEQIIIPTGIIWHCDQVATQPVGVPASMGYTLTLPAGERGMLLGGVFGPDNYGANRTITAVVNITGAKIGIIANLSMDNARIFGPPVLTNPSTAVNSTAASLGLPYMPFILPESSVIQVTGASLANTETLTGNILIATRILPPISAAIGSGVTLTTDTILQV